MKILLTGANGFVGRALLPALRQEGHEVRVAGRECPPGITDFFRLNDIGPDTEWREAFDGIDTVIHLAGHAHDADPDAHHRVNYLGTRRLAEEAAGRCRRFVFVSSLAVHGLAASDEPVTTDTPVRPDSAYGVAKAHAEEALTAIAAREGMECVILRPAVIYGPHAPGNIGRMMRAIRRGIPLPLARVANRRSLLDRDHLVRALLAVSGAPAATGGPYPLADDAPISTPAMLCALADGAGQAARLWPCPVSLLRLGAGVLGRRRMADQLTGSLVVSSEVFRDTYGAFCEHDTATGLANAMHHTLKQGNGTA